MSLEVLAIAVEIRGPVSKLKTCAHERCDYTGTNQKFSTSFRSSMHRHERNLSIHPLCTNCGACVWAEKWHSAEEIKIIRSNMKKVKKYQKQNQTRKNKLK